MVCGGWRVGESDDGCRCQVDVKGMNCGRDDIQVGEDDGENVALRDGGRCGDIWAFVVFGNICIGECNQDYREGEE